MPSADGVFSGLRQRARHVLVGKNAATAIVQRFRDCPKYVSLAALSAVFGTAGLVWSEEETAYLVRRFADNRRRIDWWRLIRALDVAPPEDFTDPERSFVDQLPQPYRLIVGILDTEIVDRAWAQIVAEHPELDTNSAGEARAATDIDIKRSCAPALWLDPLEGIPHVLEDKPCHQKYQIKTGDKGVGDVCEVFSDREDSGNNDEPESSRGKRRGKARDGNMGDSGIVTAAQWDNDGKFLFTGSRDGSVCLRRVGALEEVLGRAFAYTGGVNPVVTCLSRPVGALTDRFGRPVFIRIAAASTETLHRSKGEEHVNGDDSALVKGQEGDQSSAGVAADTGSGRAGPRNIAQPVRSRVCIFDVAFPESGSGSEGGEGDGRGKVIPTFRSVCFADLPKGETTEASPSVSLSPDGRRVAVALPSGSIATWSLPPFSPSLNNRTVKSSSSNDGEINGDRLYDTGGEDEKPVDGNPPDGGNRDAGVDKNQIINAATAAVPRLGQPEFYIPHLPSPEEKAYKKASLEYQRRVKAGEIDEASSGTADAKPSFDFHHNLKPKAPTTTATSAYHLAHASFVPDIGGGGGGLAVWRSRSNVWRLYRLTRVTPGVGTRTAAANSAVRVDETGRQVGTQIVAEEKTPGLDNVDDTITMTPIFDAGTLQSIEWLLPSPVTFTTVCYAAGGLATWDSEAWGSGANRRGSSPVYPPLVAVGTERGGVYICDGVVGTTRKGLSRHRAKVTALAFHGRRFLVSGSEDEMIHIHDIAASPTSYSGYDRGCGGDGNCVATTNLRCLHDARDSTIVRVACFQQMPLAIAEDTSGRIAVYDLLTGTMLGVLELDRECSANTSKWAAKRDTSSATGNGGGSLGAQSLICAGGGDIVAVILPPSTTEVDNEKTTAISDFASKIGIWSAADVIWGLCPGVRAMAGHERPAAAVDVAELFCALSPVQRKGGAGIIFPDNKTHYTEGDISTESPVPPRFRSRPGTGGGRSSNNSTTATLRRFHASRVASPLSAHRTGGRGGDASSRVRKERFESSPTATIAPPLTEWDSSRVLGGKSNRGLGAGMDNADGGNSSGGLGAQGEVGAAERIKRYLESLQGDRVAREARLASFTRSLLQTL